MPYTKQSQTIARLPNPVRLRFPTLFSPKPIMLGGQPKGDPFFSAGLVIPNDDTENVTTLQEAIKQIAGAAWADVTAPSQFHWPLQWGPTAYPNDANLENCWVLNANAKADNQPAVLKFGAQQGMYIPVTEAEQHLVFSGCEAYVSLGLFSYQNSPTVGGIGCGLNLVLLTQRDVGRFDSRVSASQAFGDLDPSQFGPASGAPAPQGMPQAPAPQGMPQAPTSAPAPAPAQAGAPKMPWES